MDRLLKKCMMAVLVVATCSCSGSSSPTAPTPAPVVAVPPPAASVPPPAQETTPVTPTPSVPAEPSIPTEKRHPNVTKLEFVNLACESGMTRRMATTGSSGAFWDDRRVITDWLLNDRSFKDDPKHEVAVFLGSKPGYVIVGTSVDHARLSTGQGGFMFTLWMTNEYHRSLTKTVHVTLAITEGLNYNGRADDGSLEMPLSDPRFLAYKSVKCEIAWQRP